MKKITRGIAGLALLGSMISVQGGAAFARNLFPHVGPAGATVLRIGVAAVLMALVFRPSLRALTAEQVRRILLYGLSIAGMNLAFYYALCVTPLGLCVTIEFIGPLTLALVLTRRPLDCVWTALAATGIALIVPWTHQAGDVSLSGILFALAAGTCWALYILATNHVTQIVHTRIAVTLGLSVAGLLVLPLALLEGGICQFSTSDILPALGVAAFSSAIPFTLELIALKGLARRVFSVTLSLEPAVAALSGFLLLHETLSPLQILAMGCVIIASVGSTLTGEPI